MTATIHPFRKSSAPGPRGRASGREACESLPAVTQQHVEALRQAHQHIAEAWRLKAESEAVRRRYQERQRKIEDLMRRYEERV